MILQEAAASTIKSLIDKCMEADEGQAYYYHSSIYDHPKTVHKLVDNLVD